MKDVKPVIKIKKRIEIPERNNLQNYNKNNTEINKVYNSTNSAIKSLNNPKSCYEQEEKEKNAPIKVKKITLGEKIKKNFRKIVESMSPKRPVPQNRAVTQGESYLNKKRKTKEF